MKFRELVFPLLFVALCVSACTVGSDEEEETRTIQLRQLEDMDEDRAWVLYQWYIEQGVEPCDPPPDPWHPFVTYGFCANVQHEAVPNADYDE